MVRLEPGRKTEQIAGMVAVVKSLEENCIKVDIIKGVTKLHKEKEYLLPQIAVDLL